MTKVAIMIPTMNRPEFVLRQLRFYELVNSPHSVYLSDSSDELNAGKLKEGIKSIKKFKITYRWDPPGKDYMYNLLPLIEEKYCIQMGDDDIIIPHTISDCADFLELHSEYGTCMGKQVNIRFRAEDYDKPYGVIARQTIPIGRSIEENDIIARINNFWSDAFFVCFVVRRVETEKLIRNITKDFALAGFTTEFVLLSVLMTSGKFKLIDKLGYIMQISNMRYDHDLSYRPDPSIMSSTQDQWIVCRERLLEIIKSKGFSSKESREIIEYIYSLYFGQYSGEIGTDKESVKKTEFIWKHLLKTKRLKSLISYLPFIKIIYYKIYPPQYVTRPESKYFKDFTEIKDFLETNNSE